MDERVVQARVGIVVISALLLTAILIVLFGDFPAQFRSRRVLQVRFKNAPGVAEGTPVRKSGILIGRVERVEFIEDTPDIMVTLRLNERAKLFKSEECRINTSTLLGDAVLEFVSTEPRSDQLMPLDKPIDGLTGRSPLEIVEMITNLEGDLSNTIRSVGEASDQFGLLAKQVNDFIGGEDDEQLKRLAEKSERTLDTINSTMSKMNRILGDEDLQDSLQQSLREFPKLVQQTQNTLAGIQGAVERADRNLQNLEGLTEPLGDQGAQIVDKIDSSLDQFDQVMGRLVQFTDRINRQDGTLGQLLNNPELYHNLSRAAENIERLSTEIRPILGDVRVFTDKIARDPSQLGVAGALQRNRDRTKYPNFKTSEEPPMYWREDLKPPADWRTEPKPTHIYPY